MTRASHTIPFGSLEPAAFFKFVFTLSEVEEWT